MRKGHGFHVLLAGALAAVAMLGGGQSAAATTTSGGGALVGAMSMAYPCSGCVGGSFTATAAVSLSGAPASGVAYSAVWPDPRTTLPGTVPTNFTTVSLTYTSQCAVVAPVPPLLGGGGGGFTLSGGLLVINGAAWDNATLTGAITWQWEGPTTATVVLSGATITGGAGPSQVAVTLDLANMVVGQGAMTFTWSTPTGNCAVQNPSQTALVQAAVEQPA